MAHYQCYRCSNIMVADAMPQRCESCGAPAEEAFPDGARVEERTDPEPVDHLFDDTRSSPAQRWNPAAATTLELDEDDLEPDEPGGSADGPRLVTPSMTASPPPSPLQSSPVKPVVGRVAYPIREGGEGHRAVPVEVDEMAAAGLPPVPPRPTPALAAQTRSLADLSRPRQRWQVGRVVVALGPLALLAGIAVGVLWPGSRPAPGRHVVADAGSVVAGPVRPDLALSDSLPPDQRHLPDRSSVPTPERVQIAPREPASPPGARPPVPPSPPDAAPPPPPMSADERYRAGLRLLVRGELERAVVELNGALDQNPRLSPAYRALGLAYQKLGRGALATEAFRRYLELRPDAPDAELIRKRMQP